MASVREGGAMFNVIVWATDGSPTAERALPIARWLAKSSGARLVVAHVDELVFGRSSGYHVHADEDALLARIQESVDQLLQDGVDTELKLAKVTTGGAAHVIDEIARDVGADLIVAGTRGHGPVAGLLLGSVTHRLLHIAGCPVLTVPPADASSSS
jgi:nucleotide-binding universal stress UspA family protein